MFKRHRAIRPFVNVGYVLVGNPPFWQTGYGNQLDLLGKSLVQAGRKVAHLCDWGYSGPMMFRDGVRVYPVSEHPGVLKSDDMIAHVSHFCGEEDLDDVVCIYLGDIWKWNRIAAALPNTVCLCPVDGALLHPKELVQLDSFEHIAAMSQYGLEVLEEHTGRDVLYFPHGYDDSLLGISQSSRAIRSRWGHLTNRPEPQFIVGYFGDFSERKEPEVNLLGYRKFLEQIGEEASNTLLYIKRKSEHVQAIDPGPVISSLGIPRSLVQEVSLGELKVGLSTEQVGRLLRGVDVLLHCSSQEGFGIFQIEAQAVGTPVVNTDFGPMPELNCCEDLVVPVGSMRHKNDNHYGQADSDAIAAVLLNLYQEWKDSSERWGSRSDEVTAWARDYSYSRVFEQHIWPQLQGIEEELGSPRVKVLEPSSIQHVALVSTYGIDCGIATYTKMLAEELLSLGYQVSVIAEVSEDEGSRYEPYMDGDIRIYRCWDRKYERWGMAQKILSDIQPDLLHVQHEWAIFHGQGSAGLSGLIVGADCRRVITWHTPDFLTAVRHPGDDAVLNFDSVVDLHITHNKGKSRVMSQRLNNGVTHIPHGVREIGDDEVARDGLGVPPGIPLFFSYGFLNGSKGAHILLEAGVEAAKRAPYFELVVYGGYHESIPHSKELFEMCEAIADKSPQVHFVAETISEESLDRHARGCDYLVFPYMGEIVTGSAINSSSGAVCRVVGAGKPIIATDEGRLRDFIGGVHGWKVAQSDVDALADAIVEAARVRSGFQPGRYERMADSVALLADSLSWPRMGKLHSNAYRKIGEQHCVYSARMVRLEPWDGEPCDFMSDVNLRSSTGSEEE